MILVVCTGNLHRSPVLEAVLREAGIGPVHSAGTHAPGGPAPGLLVKAAGEMGLDLGAHESRLVTREMLEEARLVLCMEREHVAELAVMHRPVFSRTMTLREAAGLFVAHPAPAGHTLEEWLAAALGGRTASMVLAGGTGLDTPDPIGGGLDEFRACVAEIRESALPVVGNLRRLLS